MPEIFYPAIGQCIYCGATELKSGARRFTDEHIIPLVLGGNLVLPQASCPDCAALINQQIETPVLFQELGYLRIKRNFPSRSKKSGTARRQYGTLTRRDGHALQVPISEYSCPVTLYKFKESPHFEWSASR